MSEEEQQEAEILKQEVIEEEGNLKSALSEKLESEKKARKKKARKRYIQLIFLGLFAFGIWWLFFNKREASPKYGVCHSILELMVPYPHTIRVSELKKTDKTESDMLLWYTFIDAFGGYRFEKFICDIDRVPREDKPQKKYWKVNRLALNKVDLDKKTLAEIEQSLVYFDKNPLILTYPRKLPNSLRGLKFNFDKFYRIQLDMTKKTR